MTISSQTIRPGFSHTVAKSVTLMARIGAKAQAVLKALQMARMLSTLSNMSDSQLAQIGISRSDIPKYAETLIAGE